MPACETDLHAHLRRIASAQNEDLVGDIFWHICLALRHCHRLDIAHCDVKPENVLLHDGSAKLCDFGSASLSCHGVISGITPAYASPECMEAARQGNTVDLSKLDVWGAGVVLYAMLTGELPWEQPTMNDPNYALWTQGQYELPDSISTDIADLLEHMWCIDPDRRLSMPDVLRHPWVSPLYIDAVPSSAPPSSENASESTLPPSSLADRPGSTGQLSDTAHQGPARPPGGIWTSPLINPSAMPLNAPQQQQYGANPGSVPRLPSPLGSDAMGGSAVAEQGRGHRRGSGGRPPRPRTWTMAGTPREHNDYVHHHIMGALSASTERQHNASASATAQTDSADQSMASEAVPLGFQIQRASRRGNIKAASLTRAFSRLFTEHHATPPGVAGSSPPLQSASSSARQSAHDVTMSDNESVGSRREGGDSDVTDTMGDSMMETPRSKHTGGFLRRNTAGSHTAGVLNRSQRRRCSTASTASSGDRTRSKNGISGQVVGDVTVPGEGLSAGRPPSRDERSRSGSDSAIPFASALRAAEQAANSGLIGSDATVLKQLYRRDSLDESTGDEYRGLGQASPARFDTRDVSAADHSHRMDADDEDYTLPNFPPNAQHQDVPQPMPAQTNRLSTPPRSRAVSMEFSGRILRSAMTPPGSMSKLRRLLARSGVSIQHSLDNAHSMARDSPASEAPPPSRPFAHPTPPMLPLTRSASDTNTAGASTSPRRSSRVSDGGGEWYEQWMASMTGGDAPADHVPQSLSSGEPTPAWRRGLSGPLLPALDLPQRRSRRASVHLSPANNRRSEPSASFDMQMMPDQFSPQTHEGSAVATVLSPFRSYVVRRPRGDTLPAPGPGRGLGGTPGGNTASPASVHDLTSRQDDMEIEEEEENPFPRDSIVAFPGSPGTWMDGHRRAARARGLAQKPINFRRRSVGQNGGPTLPLRPADQQEGFVGGTNRPRAQSSHVTVRRTMTLHAPVTAGPPTTDQLSMANQGSAAHPPFDLPAPAHGQLTAHTADDSAHDAQSSHLQSVETPVATRPSHLAGRSAQMLQTDSQTPPRSPTEDSMDISSGSSPSSSDADTWKRSYIAGVTASPGTGPATPTARNGLPYTASAYSPARHLLQQQGFDLQTAYPTSSPSSDTDARTPTSAKRKQRTRTATGSTDSPDRSRQQPGLSPPQPSEGHAPAGAFSAPEAPPRPLDRGLMVQGMSMPYKEQPRTGHGTGGAPVFSPIYETASGGKQRSRTAHASNVDARRVVGNAAGCSSHDMPPPQAPARVRSKLKQQPGRDRVASAGSAVAGTARTGGGYTGSSLRVVTTAFPSTSPEVLTAYTPTSTGSGQSDSLMESLSPVRFAQSTSRNHPATTTSAATNEQYQHQHQPPTQPRGFRMVQSPPPSPRYIGTQYPKSPMSYSVSSPPNSPSQVRSLKRVRRNSGSRMRSPPVMAPTGSHPRHTLPKGGLSGTSSSPRLQSDHGPVPMDIEIQAVSTHSTPAGSAELLGVESTVLRRGHSSQGRAQGAHAGGAAIRLPFVGMSGVDPSSFGNIMQQTTLQPFPTAGPSHRRGHAERRAQDEGFVIGFDGSLTPAHTDAMDSPASRSLSMLSESGDFMSEFQAYPSSPKPEGAPLSGRPASQGPFRQLLRASSMDGAELSGSMDGSMSTGQNTGFNFSLMPVPFRSASAESSASARQLGDGVGGRHSSGASQRQSSSDWRDDAPSRTSQLSTTLSSAVSAHISSFGLAATTRLR